MPDSYRNGAFALGLVVGGGIALKSFLWLDYRARNDAEQGAKAQSNHDYNEIGSTWDSLIGTFVSPSDTLAQWIMAFFTIAATGVVLTLRSANRTNQAAVRAAEAAAAANRIVRQAQRPWLKISISPRGGITVTQNELRVLLKFSVENIGSSPAIVVQFHWQAFRSRRFAPRQVVGNFLIGWTRSPAFNVGAHTVFPGEASGPGEDLTFDIVTEHEDGSFYLVFGVTYRMDGEDWVGYTIELHRIAEATEDSFRLELMTDGRLIK